MSRWLPFPLLSLSLFAMWVLLTGFSPGHVFIALVVGLLLPRTLLSLQVEKPSIRKIPVILKLFGMVFVDIVKSNIAVGKIILTQPKNRVPGFIYVPVNFSNRYAVACLSIIITATPGTLWVFYDPRYQIIVIHVLDLVDEHAWISLIKNRYEKLLMEIFE